MREWRTITTSMVIPMRMVIRMITPGTAMRRTVVLLAGLLTLLAVLAPAARAGSPHFISNAFSAAPAGNTLTVSINPGGNHPKAANKTSVSAAGDFPVQNGKAEFTLTVTASFQPECSPPMSVQFTDVTVTDTTNGLSHTFR